MACTARTTKLTYFQSPIRPYSREDAVYPVKWLRARKFWPTVSRVDDSYGDRNLVCECGTVDEYST